MEDFYQYIYSGSFGGYDPEKLELINDYFLNAGKKNRFFDSDTYEYVVAFLIEQGNFGQAREVLSVAENLFPDKETLSIFEILIDKYYNLENAINKSDIYFKKYNNPIFLLIKAVSLFESKRYEEGEVVHEKFINDFYTDELRAEAYFQIALLLDDNKFDNIEDNDNEFLTRSMLTKRFIDRALSYPLDIKGLIFYAIQFRNIGNLRDAQNILNRVIDKDSYNKEAWRLLSEILFDAEQYKEAAEAYKYRIAINDGDNMNHFQCGLCYSRMGQWEDALHYYELQEKNFPFILMDNKEFYLKLKNKQAECLMKMGKFEDALRICTKALKIDPNNFQITVRTAQCYNFLNDNENAIVYLLKALEMNNNHRYNEYENLFGTIGDIFSEISQEQSLKEREESISNAILAYKKSMIFLNMSDNADNKDFEDLQYTNAMNLLKIGRSYMLIGKYIDALINLQMANYINADMPTLQLTLSICYYYLDFVKESLMHFELIPIDELKEFKTLIPDLVEIEKLYKEHNR